MRRGDIFHIFLIVKFILFLCIYYLGPSYAIKYGGGHSAPIYTIEAMPLKSGRTISLEKHETKMKTDAKEHI